MRKSKNKKRFEKNKRKKALKRKQKQGEIKVLLPVPDFVEPQEHLWFAAHGANYLLSPYSEGVWNPLFDLYSGNFEVKNWSVEKLSEHVAVQRGILEDGEFDTLGVLAAAWVLLPSTIKLPLYEKLVEQVGLDKMRTPMEPSTWEFFDNLKDKIHDYVHL